MNEAFQEYVDSRGLAVRVDRDRGIIRGVKILGTRSKNGRTYRSEAIETAAALYEGAKVNVNHTSGAVAGPRDYQDRIGVIRNVTARRAEGLFGDLHFNPKHALAEQLLWDAEHAPQNVGFSHNVLARTTRRGDTVVVEAITQVESVDLVADPATTRGLFESADESASVLEALTAEQLRAARPDLIEVLVAEHTSPLAAEIDRLKAAEAERVKGDTVRRLLAEFHLAETDETGGLVSESFLDTLMQTEDEAAMRRLIQERVALAGGHATAGPPAGRPLSREQSRLYAERPGDVEAFVRSIS